MVDISSIKTQERTIEIMHPANSEQKLGIMISMVALSDPRMKRLKRKIHDEKLRLEAKGKHFKADDLENNANELLCNAMTGWRWYNPTGEKGDDGYNEDAQALFKGKVPEFNRMNVLAVLNEPGMDWFANQLHDAINEEKDFFGNSNGN